MSWIIPEFFKIWNLSLLIFYMQFRIWEQILELDVSTILEYLAPRTALQIKPNLKSLLLKKFISFTVSPPALQFLGTLQLCVLQFPEFPNKHSAWNVEDKTHESDVQIWKGALDCSPFIICLQNTAFQKYL